MFIKITIFVSTIFLAKIVLCDELNQSVQLANIEGKKSQIDGPFPSYENALQKKRGVFETSTHGTNLKEVKRILSKFLSKWRKRGRRAAAKSGHTKSTKEPQKEGVNWHPWTNWSTCSVTCGKGRVIRWRHCKENCNELETEMEEKACQLPACEHKLFGVIKL